MAVTALPSTLLLGLVAINNFGKNAQLTSVYVKAHRCISYNFVYFQFTPSRSKNGFNFLGVWCVFQTKVAFMLAGWKKCLTVLVVFGSFAHIPKPSCAVWNEDREVYQHLPGFVAAICLLSFSYSRIHEKYMYWLVSRCNSLCWS